MFGFLSNFLQKKHIDCLSPIPLSACRITRPYLLEQAGICNGTVFMIAVPYFTPACAVPSRNISAYAVSRDYHLFFRQLFGELLPLLRERYPSHRFTAFADHSPIDEIHAAAAAGLGIVGKNHMLITPKYSSYVFLAELVTDAVVDCQAHEIAYCLNCGACMRACPSYGSDEECLSALTQKKGALSSSERLRLLSHPLLWGCDICQEVCPHTKKALESGSIYSPVPFFSEEPIPRLGSEVLASMSDEEFSTRAYAWRKRETIQRNVHIKEKGDVTCSD